MKDTLKSIFRNYSYLNDEIILSSLLERVDYELLKNIKSLDDLDKFLFQLDKQVDKNDLLCVIFKLQANIQIMEYAFKDNDDDLALCMKTLNSQNIKFLNEIVAMLDFRELEKYGQ
jgi:hypothetical protein